MIHKATHRCFICQRVKYALTNNTAVTCVTKQLAVKSSIFIFSFHRFFAEFASIIVSALLSFSIREQVQHRLLRQQDIPELQYMPYHSPHCFYYNISTLASSLQFPLFSDVCLFFTRRCGYRQSDKNVSIPLAAFFDLLIRITAPGFRCL